MTQENMTYAGSGVNYSAMDPFKVTAQAYARRTSGNAPMHHLEVLEWTRGESVTLCQHVHTGRYSGHVHEGLGTKNLVADLVAKQSGRPTNYAGIAKCTLAMGLNDMITLGVDPVMVAMHLAVAEDAWFDDESRYRSLLQGWADACDEACVAWMGGETPTLKGVIVPGACELSCSVHGVADKVFVPSRIQAGDAIIGFASSGIHANGLTLARKIADKLHDGYMTRLGSGRTYGERLLEPTHIYVEAVRYAKNLVSSNGLRYGINVTGHGWRKLMRAKGNFRYVMDANVPVPEVLSFMQDCGNISDEEAYGNLNMGLGFALIVRERDADTILGNDDMRSLPFDVFRAGYVEAADQSEVVIPWKNLTFKSDTLQVR